MALRGQKKLPGWNQRSANTEQIADLLATLERNESQKVLLAHDETT